MSRRTQQIREFRRRRIPFANNGLNTKLLYQQRRLYRKVYEGKGNTIDFWYDDTLYGRIDHEGNAIYPKESFLKEITLPYAPAAIRRNSIFVLDFVAIAFEAFRKEFVKKHENEAPFQAHKYFSPNRMSAKKGWLSVNTFYHNQVMSLYESFISTYLSKDLDRSRQAVNYDKFTDLFLEFVERVGSKSPFTRTNIIKSLYCPPNINGLCVEISNEDYSDDLNKHRGIYESRYFNSYRRTALRHGFLIDKNAPWRLVANINSRPMQNYMYYYGTTIDNIYEKVYNKAYLYDMPSCRTYIKQFYNSYLAAQPIVRDSEGQTITRRPLGEQEFETKYTTRYWIAMYAGIRNSELHKRLSEKKLSRVIKKALEIHQHIGLRRSVDYINTVFMGQNTPTVVL